MEKTNSALSQKGTNMYMAPEVFRGERYNHTVDIYSLGIMMYRLLNNGRFPFMPQAPQPLRYTDSEDAMRRRMTGEKIPFIPNVSRGLQNIILKACEFKPENRYQRAEDMLSDLTALDLKESVQSFVMDSNSGSERTEVLFEDEEEPYIPKEDNRYVKPDTERVLKKDDVYEDFGSGQANFNLQ